VQSTFKTDIISHIVNAITLNLFFRKRRDTEKAWTIWSYRRGGHGEGEMVGGERRQAQPVGSLGQAVHVKPESVGRGSSSRSSRRGPP